MEDKMRFKTETIKANAPIVYLRHEPTHSVIPVYKRMNLLQRLMLKWCFGLEYKQKE